MHCVKTSVQITTVILLSITFYSYLFKIAQNDIQLDETVIWYLLILFSYFQFFQHMWRAFSNLEKQVGKGDTHHGFSATNIVCTFNFGNKIFVSSNGISLICFWPRGHSHDPRNYFVQSKSIFLDMVTYYGILINPRNYYGQGTWDNLSS